MQCLLRHKKRNFPVTKYTVPVLVEDHVFKSSTNIVFYGVNEAELSVKQSVDVFKCKAYGEITYFITVKNMGPSKATGVFLEVKLFECAFLAGVDIDKGTYEYSNCKVLCHLGDIEKECVSLVKISVVPKKQGLICNYACACCNEFDPDLSNNSSLLILNYEHMLNPVYSFKKSGL